MSPQAGRAFFRIPMFLLVCSAVLLLLEPRDSAAFYISLVTFVVALLFAAAVAAAVRLFNR